jgi:hypothetical protein
MLLGENFVKEFNEQQEKFKRKNKHLNENYLECDLPIERMLLEMAVKEEMMYLHNMMRIKDFEQKIDPVFKKYYPEYKNSEELMKEGVLSDGADMIANWYSGLSKMEKMDLGVDIGVSALSLIPKIGAVPAVLGMGYYLFRAGQAYNQGNRFEAVIHFISAVFTAFQVFPVLGTGAGAVGKLFTKIFTAPFATLAKIFAHFGGRLSKTFSTGTYELASFFGFGSRLTGTHVDQLIKAAKLADSEKVYIEKAMSILQKKLDDDKFREMLQMAIPGLDFSNIPKVADQAKLILGALEGSKNKDKFEIVVDLVETIGKTDMAEGGADAALKIRRQIEAMEALGDDAADKLVEINALVEKAGKLTGEADLIDNVDLSGKTPQEFLDELEVTRQQLQTELAALADVSPGVKQLEQLKVRLKQSLNAIDIKLAKRPIARSTSLRAGARSILADKDRLYNATKQPLQEFGEAVFELAEGAGEAFAKEFHEQLSTKSGREVIGQLKNPSDPADKLKLLVQKENTPDFDTWLQSADGLKAQKEILQKNPEYNKRGMFGGTDAEDTQIIQNSMDDLRSMYNTGNVDEIPFDEFILDYNISLSKVLANNDTLTEIKRQALADTKSIDAIAKNFIKEIPETVGESEYRRYRAKYTQYFSTELYLKPGSAQQWFAKMHNKIADESILAEYWSESIPDKYGLVIKKVALNLFADPVINFLNDDTESMGESEAIDASILNNLSRAAHAAGSSLGTAIDMSTTNYNF